MTAPPVLAVERLSVRYPVRNRGRSTSVTAVDDVSFAIAAGETLGLVGESGCGKSTTARGVLFLVEPDAASIRVAGTELIGLPAEELRRQRRRMQLVFQDPFASFDPKRRVGAQLAEPLAVYRLLPRADRPARVAELLDRVGLPGDAASRYPHEFSGGQRQRLGIARAIASEPDLLVLDEPVSALDVSIQAQVLQLLAELQGQSGLAYLFISHDLAVVRRVATRVAVMYLGRIVEEAPVDAIFAAPRHPYTQALLSAVPRRSRDGLPRLRLHGELPSPLDPPSGCRFRTRCPHAVAACAEAIPPLEPVSPNGDHVAACLRWGELPAWSAGERGVDDGEQLVDLGVGDHQRGSEAHRPVW